MPIQVGDWVQTNTRQIGKVSSVDADGALVTITRVDPDRLRMVAETYSINELRKLEIRQ